MSMIMIGRTCLFVALTMTGGYLQAQDDADVHGNAANIGHIIAAFRTGDAKKIADFVQFPISRQYPLQRLNNPQDFDAHFDEIFTEKDLCWIGNSHVTDWIQLGWRGVQFKGVVWLGNDERKIEHILAISEKGEQARHTVIENDRKMLHECLQSYKEPILEWTTKKYHVRVDRLSDADRLSYRYASWKRGHKTDEIPDAMLIGDIHFGDGSGGGYEFRFSRGSYRYVCDPNVGIGDGSYVGQHVRVYKDVRQGQDPESGTLILDEVVLQDRAEQ